MRVAVNGAAAPVEPLGRAPATCRAAPMVVHSGPGFCLRQGKAPIWRHHFLLEDSWTGDRGIVEAKKHL